MLLMLIIELKPEYKKESNVTFIRLIYENNVANSFVCSFTLFKLQFYLGFLMYYFCFCYFAINTKY